MPNLQPTSVVMSVLYHPRPCLYHEQLLVFLTGEVSLSASLAGFLQAPSVKTQKHTNLEALNCHRSNIYILCFPLITSSFLFVFPRRADRFLTDLSETNFFMLSASVQKPDLIKMLFQQSRFLKKKTFIIF